MDIIQINRPNNTWTIITIDVGGKTQDLHLSPPLQRMLLDVLSGDVEKDGPKNLRLVLPNPNMNVHGVVPVSDEVWSHLTQYASVQCNPQS